MRRRFYHSRYHRNGECVCHPLSRTQSRRLVTATSLFAFLVPVGHASRTGMSFKTVAPPSCNLCTEQPANCGDTWSTGNERCSWNPKRYKSSDVTSASSAHGRTKVYSRSDVCFSPDLPKNYTPADAVQEYKDMERCWEEAKETRKANGMQWACFICNEAFPAECFQADPNNANEVKTRCITTGHWRQCIACSSSIEAVESNDGKSNGTRSCIACRRSREAMFFEDEADVCTSCVQRQKYAAIQCNKCGKFVTFATAMEDPNTPGMFVMGLERQMYPIFEWAMFF